MGKLYSLFWSMILCFGGICLRADIIADAKKNYTSPEYLEQHVLTVKDGYVIVAQSARIIGSQQAANTAARLGAGKMLFKLKEQEIDVNSVNPGWQDVFRHRLFLQYQSIAPFRCSAKNAIVIADYVRDGKYFYAVAYHMSDVVFTPPVKLTVQHVFDTLKQYPGKRDELLFFELVPANGDASLPKIDRGNLIRQYGQMFALMFYGEKIPQLFLDEYHAGQRRYSTFDASSGFGVLIAAVNRVPYDKHLCTMLADKFAEFQMPKCAGIMRLRSGEGDKKLTLVQPQPEVARKSTVTANLEITSGDVNANPKMQSMVTPQKSDVEIPSYYLKAAKSESEAGEKNDISLNQQLAPIAVPAGKSSEDTQMKPMTQPAVISQKSDVEIPSYYLKAAKSEPEAGKKCEPATSLTSPTVRKVKQNTDFNFIN